jgi:hypothetical protein
MRPTFVAVFEELVNIKKNVNGETKLPMQKLESLVDKGESFYNNGTKEEAVYNDQNDIELKVYN